MRHLTPEKNLGSTISPLGNKASGQKVPHDLPNHFTASERGSNLFSKLWEKSSFATHKILVVNRCNLLPELPGNKLSFKSVMSEGMPEDKKTSAENGKVWM